MLEYLLSLLWQNTLFGHSDQKEGVSASGKKPKTGRKNIDDDDDDTRLYGMKVCNNPQ